MLTFEDCVALSGLTEAEIEAIAEHEHLPEMVALELGHYLICQKNGAVRVRAMLADDLRHAEAIGNHRHARELRKVLHHFIAHHLARERETSANITRRR